MARPTSLRFDEIGYWSEVKLDIVREYATAYSKILTAQRRFTHVYIDAFAGAGLHVTKATGKFVLASPLNALNVKPPFREFHLIDLDHARVEHLRTLTDGQLNVSIYEGDANQLLLSKILPRVRYEDYQRGLCLLDPYGLTLRWDVVEAAGRLRTIDLFLNFPIMDMNRNALWHDADAVDPEEAERMTSFWGDSSWRDVAYDVQGNLFAEPDLVKKPGNEPIVAAYAARLRDIAGFKHVPPPMPMTNTKGAVVYYLFFASPKDTANKIVLDIFKKHGARASGLAR